MKREWNLYSLELQNLRATRYVLSCLLLKFYTEYAYYVAKHAPMMYIFYHPGHTCRRLNSILFYLESVMFSFSCAFLLFLSKKFLHHWSIVGVVIWICYSNHIFHLCNILVKIPIMLELQTTCSHHRLHLNHIPMEGPALTLMKKMVLRQVGQ